MQKLITPSSIPSDSGSDRFNQTAPAQGVSRTNAATRALAAAAMLAAYGTPASAAVTDFTNADGANSLISNAGNWDLGLPDTQQGTIGINAQYDATVTHTDYDVIHSAGNLTMSGNGSFKLSNSTWLMNGTAAFNGRGLNLSNSTVFTIDNGSFTTANNNSIVVTNSQMILNGGTVTADRGIVMSGGGNFTINGGTVTSDIADPFAFGGFQGSSPAGSLNFNGGTLTAGRFAFQMAGDIATFGGSTSGSASFVDWGTGNGAGNTGDRVDDRNISLNFLSGSKMTLSLGSGTRELDFDDDTVGDAGAAWAQALWGQGQLFYTDGLTTVSGSDPDTLGWSIVSWANVTNSTIGFGTSSNEYFNWTAAGTYGGSLSLAPLVPEPASLALLGLGGLLVLGRGGRRKG